jgi:hypothetical protein
VDADTIVAAIVPPGLGPAPRKPLTPLGPKVEDNSAGRVSQARTYPDLLQGPYDEQVGGGRGERGRVMGGWVAATHLLRVPAEAAPGQLGLLSACLSAGSQLRPNPIPSPPPPLSCLSTTARASW